MLTTEQFLNGLSRQLTLRFFATFARLEFAMKHTGCLRRGHVGDVAEADRHILVERLSADFFERVRRSNVASTLIQEPPRNLYLQQQGLPNFGEVSPPLTSTRDLINAVWRVRNNLFHGNKMRPSNRERDQALMADALNVIEAILLDNDALRLAFDESQ